MFADEVAASISRLTLARAADKSREIIGSLRRELSTENIFVVERQWSKFLDPDEKIAAVLEQAFPRAAFDFVEAGKCLCFGRATAAVMHLMRSLEAPLSLLASELGVTVAEDDTWGAVLSKCRIEIRNRDSGKGIK
jgi:hypothetical protein